MNQHMKLITCVAAVSFGMLVSSRAEVVTVEATGIGQTRAEAVTHGLVEAVQKATGVRVDQMAITGLNQRVLQVDGNVNQSNTLTSGSLDFSGTAKVSQGMDMIATQSGGSIKSYQVVSMDKDSRGAITVKMKVEVDKFKSVLGDQNKRVRLAVAEFEGLDRDTAQRLQDALKAYFVQARRFSVVDRSEGAQYAKEMALVTSPSAALSERVRFGQVLGADFIVVGKVRTEKSQRKTLDPITMAEGMREIVTADVTFSAIEIATSQILWANTIKVVGGANVAASIDGISRMVGAQVSETLYPLRVISADDANALTINQGGQSVSLGQRFALMQLGAELKDPDTKESLGRKETEVGLVEITRVETNVSYAKLVSGKLTKGTSMILRKPAVMADAGAPTNPNSGTRSKAFD